MNPLRVVLVDDHEVVRAGLRALVDGTPGMQVVGEARDGTECMLRVRDCNPEVVVMDITMPGIGGAEATTVFPVKSMIAANPPMRKGNSIRLDFPTAT